MFSDKSTPAVILTCFKHGGLAVVRSLGRLGVPVYTVHETRATPAFFSRYCKRRFVWDLHRAPAEESLGFLTDLGERIGRRSLLIAMSDLGAMFVADHAHQLSKWFVFPKQQSRLVHSLCSKREMYYLARRWNVPTPHTAFPQSRADVTDYLTAAQFPILLKPINPKQNPWPIRLVHTEHELFEYYDAVEDPSTPNVMLQEYIPGGDEYTWTFNGYFDQQGECCVAFTGRKLRNYPPYFGMASLGICIHNEHVARTTVDFMKAIGYRGPLDLGYRYDARDGLYKVNDINPRIGGMFRLFVGANGMDVARALYQDMTGQEILPATTVEGRKWIVEDCDWISALRYYRDGKLTLRGYYDSLRSINETSYLAKDDPWPVAGAVIMNVANFCRKISRSSASRRVKLMQGSAAA
jgi:D-aspartate ligase